MSGNHNFKIAFKMLTYILMGVFIACNPAPSSRKTPLIGSPLSPDDTFTRPNAQVFIQFNYCACKFNNTLNLNEAYTGGCDNFCAATNDQELTLHIPTAVGPEISSNDNFGDLRGWCENSLPEQGSTPPECMVRFSYNTVHGQQFVDIEDNQLSLLSNNWITVALPEILPFDSNIGFQIIEKSSGASSDSKITILTNPADPDPPVIETLSSRNIHQYSCANRIIDNGLELFSSLTYYSYPDLTVPPVIQWFDDIGIPPRLHCHNVDQFGNFDNILYQPRLHLKSSHMKLWDESDARFFDISPTDGVLDINKQIQDLLAAPPFGFTRPDLEVFTPLQWPSYPFDSPNQPPLQGFMMNAWIDGGEFFCPTSNDHFNKWDPSSPNEDDAIFQIIGDLVQFDTEALYLATKGVEYFTPPGGNPLASPLAYILIKESDLFSRGFHIQGNSFPVATRESAQTQQVHFYWPPCEAGDPQCDPANITQQQNITLQNPTKIVAQKLFNVVTPQQAFGGEADNFGFRTNINPSDKRVGCVPTQ